MNCFLDFYSAHLGGTAITVSGITETGEVRYHPFGADRFTSGITPTSFKYTGQRQESGIGLYYYGARWYDPALGRFIQPDTIVPDPGDAKSFDRYAYVLNNPLKYNDPTGHTVRSALDQIRYFRASIISIANANNIDPMLLAGVVFSENRNDRNWLRDQDWTSFLGFGAPEVKNLLAPHLDHNPSLGVTEVSLGVAAMMDNLSLVPDNYGAMSWEERAALQDNIAKGLAPGEREAILNSLSDPDVSLTYTATYLAFLQSYRDYGDNYELWLSDYNRGLSDWDTATPYGQRYTNYSTNIAHSLYFKEPLFPVCQGVIGAGGCIDQVLYGELPQD